jgi:hypothetical protein
MRIFKTLFTARRGQTGNTFSPCFVDIHSVKWGNATVSFLCCSADGNTYENVLRAEVDNIGIVHLYHSHRKTRARCLVAGLSVYDVLVLLLYRVYQNTPFSVVDTSAIEFAEWENHVLYPKMPYTPFYTHYALVLADFIPYGVFSPYYWQPLEVIHLNSFRKMLITRLYPQHYDVLNAFIGYEEEDNSQEVYEMKIEDFSPPSLEMRRISFTKALPLPTNTAIFVSFDKEYPIAVEYRDTLNEYEISVFPDTPFTVDYGYPMPLQMRFKQANFRRQDFFVIVKILEDLYQQYAWQMLHSTEGGKDIIRFALKKAGIKTGDIVDVDIADTLKYQHRLYLLSPNHIRYTDRGVEMVLHSVFGMAYIYDTERKRLRLVDTPLTAKGFSSLLTIRNQVELSQAVYRNILGYIRTYHNFYLLDDPLIQQFIRKEGNLYLPLVGTVDEGIIADLFNTDNKVLSWEDLLHITEQYRHRDLFIRISHDDGRIIMSK